MTIELNGITTNSTASTVLDYEINTNPNPLQISSTGSISIAVSKQDPPAAQCTSLVFGVGVGSAAADLTTDPANISTQCPSGWSVTPDGAGNFTFTPNPNPDHDNGKIGQVGLLFVLSNIAVNSQVGTSYLSITENLQSGTSNGSLPLPKFPVNFTVSDLTADSYNINPGGTVNLSWNGSPGGNYSLSYSGNTFSGLPNVDSYPVKNLQETTTFTLTITAEGGTIQLVRQCTVSVKQPVIEEFGIVVDPAGTLILANSPFQLYWQTQNADYCILAVNSIPTGSNLPANVDKTQGYTVTAPATGGRYSYTLTAVRSQGGSGPVANLIVNVYPIAINITSAPKQTLISADGSRLYVIGDKLTVIDTATRTVIQTIDVGMDSFEYLVSTSSIVLSPDESHLYVACTTDGLLKVVDTSSWQVRSVSVPGVSGFLAVAMGSSSGSYLIVNGALPNENFTLWVLDPSNNYSLVHQLEPNVNLLGAMSANPQGDQVFCVGVPPSNSMESDLPPLPLSCYFYAVDANTLSQVAQGQSINIPLPLLAPYVTSSPDGSCYYTGGVNILGVEASTGNVSAQTPTLDFVICGLTFSPDESRLYVSASVNVNNDSNDARAALYFLDTALKNPLCVYTCTFGSIPGGIAVSPDGKTLYMPIAAQSPQVLVFQFL